MKQLGALALALALVFAFVPVLHANASKCYRKSGFYHHGEKQGGGSGGSGGSGNEPRNSYADFIDKKQAFRKILVASINWDDVRNTLKEEFIGECRQRNGSSSGYLYDYSAALNLTLRAAELRRGNRSQAENATIILEFDTANVTVGFVCNASVAEVSYRIVGDTASSSAMRTNSSEMSVEVTFSGISVAQPYMRSASCTDDCFEIATEAIYPTGEPFTSAGTDTPNATAEATTAEATTPAPTTPVPTTPVPYTPVPEARRGAVIISDGCASASMDLILEVVPLTRAFNRTVGRLNVSTHETESYYRCVLKGGSNCEYLAENIIERISTEDLLKEYVDATAAAIGGAAAGGEPPKERRRSRRWASDEEQVDHLMCLYRAHGSGVDAERACDAELAASGARSRRDTSSRKKSSKPSAPRSLPGTPLQRYIRKLGLLPSTAKFLQVGYSGTDGSVHGDASVYHGARNNVSSVIKKLLPTIPEELSAEELYRRLLVAYRDAQQRHPGEDALSETVRDLLARKFESTLAALCVLRSEIEVDDSEYVQEDNEQTPVGQIIAAAVAACPDRSFEEMAYVDRYGSKDVIEVLEEVAEEGAKMVLARDGEDFEAESPVDVPDFPRVGFLQAESSVPTNIEGVDISSSLALKTDLETEYKKPSSNTQRPQSRAPRSGFGPAVMFMEKAAPAAPALDTTLVLNRRCRRAISDSSICGMVGGPPGIRPLGSFRTRSRSSVRSSPGSSALGNRVLSVFSLGGERRRYSIPARMRSAPSGTTRLRVDSQNVDANLFERSPGSESGPAAASAVAVIPKPKSSLYALIRRMNPDSSIYKVLRYHEGTRSEPSIPQDVSSHRTLGRSSSATAGTSWRVRISIGSSGESGHRRRTRGESLSSRRLRRPRPRETSSSTSGQGIDISEVRVPDRALSSRSRSSSISSVSSIASIPSRSLSYRGSMRDASDKLDFYNLFSDAMGKMSVHFYYSYEAAKLAKFGGDEQGTLDKLADIIFSAGTTLSAMGFVAGPVVGLSGIALQSIAGVMDVGIAIYNLLQPKQEQPDPLAEMFDSYQKYIEDSERLGVRTCLQHGKKTVFYLSYRKDSSFKPSTDKLAEYFLLDTISSEVRYLANSDVLTDYHVEVVCPLGTLRSADYDINAFATLTRTGKDGSKHYELYGLGAALTACPVLTLTCGRDASLTFSPYSVPLSRMQLLRVATQGEPEETKSMPSNVCDIFPLKRFYLLVGGCPYDASMRFITYTTCSILLRKSTWDNSKERWVLLNPFNEEGEYKQLFIFSKFDFKDVTLRPNENPAHANLCTRVDSSQCVWTEEMILEDVTECQSRTRKLYIEIGTYGGPGFGGLVLSCSSGASPVVVGKSNDTMELTITSDYRSKMVGSPVQETFLAFCASNVNSKLKSDVLVVTTRAVIPSHRRVFDLRNQTDLRRLFEITSDYMPERSKTCDRDVYSDKPCFRHWSVPYLERGYRFRYRADGEKVTISSRVNPDDYDPALEESRFYSGFKISFNASEIADAYENPSRMWKDAANGVRTFSSISAVVAHCNIRNKMLELEEKDFISELVYIQSIKEESEYLRDGKYIFEKTSHSTKPKAVYASKYRQYPACRITLDASSRMVEVYCPPYSLLRNFDKGKAGICVVLTSSMDHCAAQPDDEYMKVNGYKRAFAYMGWDCRHRREGFSWQIDEKYCSYGGNYNTQPIYDPCTGAIFVEYRDLWVQEVVMQPPPYTYHFSYDSVRNEYADTDTYEKLQQLYDTYVQLLNYNSSLSASIERLASSLSDNGRRITEVLVDSTALEISYMADQEKLAELLEEISRITQEVFANTLSDEDIRRIHEQDASLRCCIVDIIRNITEKSYPFDWYMCGNVSEYRFRDTFNNSYLLVNGTYVPENRVLSLGGVFTTCLSDSVVLPLRTEEERVLAEETVFMAVLREELQAVFAEYDRNISVIMAMSAIMREEEPEDWVDPMYYLLLLPAIISLVFFIALIRFLYRRKYFRMYTIQYNGSRGRWPRLRIASAPSGYVGLVTVSGEVRN
ncbi:surface glycoprotein [Eastern grey kangaroopox virus]|uniref:Surface glycoprotein n=1 Tax=Eastern grey kangaroopox virus TaxID=2042482 RepID=A0A2H4QTF8_9POXV|nr:surface glycoprotein [Eastern grey kangaroopox virus]